MNRVIIAVLVILNGLSVYSETLLVRVKRDTVLFEDYKQHRSVCKITAGEVVEILSKEQAHLEDNTYWGFDLLIHNASIRIKYRNTSGYVYFYDLEPVSKKDSIWLDQFEHKILVPIRYCDVLQKRSTKPIEDSDPFILNYNEYIKYFFIDDLYQNWESNYPVNKAFVNGLFIQYGSIPSRYIFKAFIKKIEFDSFTCRIESNIDMFGLFQDLEQYEVGKEYTFKYKRDGDYINVFSGSVKIFEGAFIDETTWGYIYSFIKKDVALRTNNKYSNDSNYEKIKWPRHANGKSDYGDKKFD